MNLTSTWRQSSFFAGFDGTYTTDDYTISIRGDTSIDGRTYFLPVRNGIVTVRSFLDGSIIEQYPQSQDLNPIREENAILYWYHDGTGLDVSWHDFNLSVGDTALSNCLEIVEYIDTIYLGSIPKRRYFFEGNTVEQLIEGIGATRGLFHQPCSQLYFEAAYSLQCYQQDGHYVQFDSSLSCEMPLAVQGLNTFDKIARVFPNPFRDQLSIEFFGELKIPFSITLKSLHGYSIRNFTFTSPQQHALIDVSDMPSGVYILQIGNSSSLFATRVVKQ